MSDVGTKTIGAALRQARLDGGYSLGDVVAALKIREVHLEALEAEDFASLPGDVYVIGFIRAYGEYLGLDASALVADFKQTHLGHKNVKSKTPKDSGEKTRAKKGAMRPRKEMRVPPAAQIAARETRWGLIGGVAAGVIIIAALIIWWVIAAKPFSTSSPPPAEVKQVATKPAAKKQVQPKPVAQAAPTIPTTRSTFASPDSLPPSIEVRATRRTWMRIENKDGRILFSSIVNRGDKFTLDLDSDYILATRDAGALVFYNGDKRLRAVGRRGQILTARTIAPAEIVQGRYNPQ